MQRSIGMNRCHRSTLPSIASRRRAVTVRAAAASAVETDSWKAQLRGARSDVEALIRQTRSNPILIRLAWHDSGTYDKSVTEPWPKPGGATGSIRFNPEIGHGANAGLQGALDLMEPIKQKYPLVSYADLYQMASAIAVEIAGGPAIPLRYGRVDVDSPEDCAPEGRLPSAGHPFGDGSQTPADHLRRVFYRMGLDDKDIVALSGAHTLGRARPSRSGWGNEVSKYTSAPHLPEGAGAGGTPWTVNWLTFDNSYFVEVKEKRDADLLVLPTDAAVFEDEGFRQYAEKYAADQDAFFADYVQSHLKLSELGSKFAEGTAVTLD